MGLLAWSPLAGGALTGKYRAATPVNTRADTPYYEGFRERYVECPGSRQVVEAVRLIAQAMDVPPGAVALAWLQDRPGVASVIVGARDADQLKASMASCEVRLPAELAQALAALSAPLPETAEHP